MKIELLGGYTKDELDSRIKKVAAAGKLSRYPGNVLEVLETSIPTNKEFKTDIWNTFFLGLDITEVLALKDNLNLAGIRTILTPWIID